MAYQADAQRGNVKRILLQESSEGCYIFVFKTRDANVPEQDYLQSDLEMAMRACEEDYGIPQDRWVQIEDTGLA
jgi:hypothetical protein